MGKDDIFKKKRAERRKRKFENRQPHAHSYLIICEGKETEPNYFNGLNTKIQKKIGGQIKIESIPIIDVIGEGQNTTSLVNIVEKRVKEAKIIYENIWIVFDKDDFEQFDKAIKTCDYNVAWSNPNFELWLLSHFKKVNRYISKDNVLQELSKEFQKKGLGEYTKNDTNIFEKVTSEERLHTAIKNCEYMEELNKDGQESRRNPMTKVYKIIDGLKEYLE